MYCTKPSKVAARLSLADWLLVVLVGAVASLCPPRPTVAASTDAMVALVRALILGDMVVRSIF